MARTKQKTKRTEDDRGENYGAGKGVQKRPQKMPRTGGKYIPTFAGKGVPFPHSGGKSLSMMNPNVELPKRRRRCRPGTKAVREIRQYQKGTDLLFRKLPFQRLVRQIAQEYKADLRFQKNAVLAIQEATEAFVVRHFQISERLAEHANRTTIQVKDSEFAVDIVNGKYV